MLASPAGVELALVVRERVAQFHLELLKDFKASQPEVDAALNYVRSLDGLAFFQALYPEADPETSALGAIAIAEGAIRSAFRERINQKGRQAPRAEERQPQRGATPTVVRDSKKS